jgi:hypothetical protein
MDYSAAVTVVNKDGVVMRQKPNAMKERPKSIATTVPSRELKQQMNEQDDLDDSLKVIPPTSPSSDLKASLAKPVQSHESLLNEEGKSRTMTPKSPAKDQKKAQQLKQAVQALGKPGSPVKKSASTSASAAPSAAKGKTAPKSVSSPAPKGKVAPTPKASASKKAEKKARPPTPPGSVRCEHCERAFAEDRFEKHQSVCLSRPDAKQRKVMSGTQLRTQGTEFEESAKKAAKGGKDKSPSPKKSDWRKQHEEFIKAIRAAKV